MLGVWAMVYLASTLKAQDNLLQSGPMVGYSEMSEVALWVQTTQTAMVHFVYWDKEKPTVKMKTETQTTTADKAFVAKFILPVTHSKKYQYELYINNKLVKRPYPLEFQSQVLWQYRTDAPDFSFAYGSCNYVNQPETDRPGEPYGGNYEIFKVIHEKRPDFMIWGGDNIYLRETDWNTRTGFINRYTHTRSLPEMQPLLASTHHYALWDDHDYGPNNSDRGFWNKRLASEMFKLFWANPNYVFDDGSITGTFFWADVQFFILDNRFYKTPEYLSEPNKAIISDKQIAWLKDALSFSRATFKIILIGGQVLNSHADYETLATCPEERQKLIQAIQESKARGVLFISGDRHHSEISRLENGVKYPLIEFTSSPLTAGVSNIDPEKEKNIYRVPNTFLRERSFALFKVSGKNRERKLTVQYINYKGEERVKYEVRAEELK